MAGTINLSTSVNFTYGSDRVNKSIRTGSLTVTSAPRSSGTVSVGTTEEALPLSDVSSVGWVVIQNLDATNYIQVGTTSNQYTIKLKAGESCSFRGNANNVYVKANTAACLVAFDIFSD